MDSQRRASMHTSDAINYIHIYMWHRFFRLPDVPHHSARNRWAAPFPDPKHTWFRLGKIFELDEMMTGDAPQMHRFIPSVCLFLINNLVRFWRLAAWFFFLVVTRFWVIKDLAKFSNSLNLIVNNRHIFVDASGYAVTELLMGKGLGDKREPIKY